MNSNYERIKRQVEAAYPVRSYKVSFYLGVPNIEDNIWIAKHVFGVINVISLVLIESGYRYTVHFGKDHYIREYLSYVTFESDRILDLRNVNKQVSVEIQKYLTEND